jgi:GNAT superfamily N-acetyltransferase
MHIVRAKPEDASTLTRIAGEAKRHWGYPEEWMERWRDLLTIRPEQVQTGEIYCASVAGETVGFYGLRRDGGVLWLEHLWVLPTMMGRGVGRGLFHHAVERTRALGFESLRIESDPNAEGFYQRMAARRVGTNVTESEWQRRELPVLIYEICQMA